MKKLINSNRTWTTKHVFALCFNIMSILLEILALVFLFTIAIQRKPEADPSTGGLISFKYFTTDSNILLLIASLISVIYLSLLWSGKIKKIPEWEYIFKLIAVVCTTLTMFVTLFLLLPGSFITQKFIPKALYLGSNLFMHLICPLVGIVSFFLFENRKDIKLTKTLYAFIPVVIYCIFYLSFAYTHIDPTTGKPLPKYDWYSFCSFGYGVMVALLIGLFGFYYLFTWCLWLGNKKIVIKSLNK